MFSLNLTSTSTYLHAAPHTHYILPILGSLVTTRLSHIVDDPTSPMYTDRKPCILITRRLLQPLQLFLLQGHRQPSPPTGKHPQQPTYCTTARGTARFKSWPFHNLAIPSPRFLHVNSQHGFPAIHQKSVAIFRENDTW